MLLISATVLAPWKGISPESMRYSVTPSEKRSVEGARSPLPAHCSGDMYSGVPRNSILRRRRRRPVLDVRDAEVAQADASLLVEQNVRGLHVAVDDARAVRAVQRVRDLQRDLQRMLPRDHAPLRWRKCSSDSPSTYSIAMNGTPFRMPAS
jgi:hypothetical protein